MAQDAVGAGRQSAPSRAPAPATAIYFDPAQAVAAHALARRLSGQAAAYQPSPGPFPALGWHLFLDAAGLALRKTGERRPFRLTPAAFHRRSAASRLAIARACGAGPGLRLLDATAGWGTDGLTLASLGCDATLAESNPKAFALLEDMARRTRSAARLELIDARSKMPDGFDVICLDPMFERDGKGALPGKPLQILRELTREPGAPPDVGAAELLHLARRCASDRVVLKRRANAPALACPDWQIRGRTVRFDVYRPF